MATSTRIFSFGLGRSPSRSLVKGLARATNGRFVFIPPESSVDVHVGEQLQKALQPCITNVQFQWHLGTVVSTTVPTKTPPVYVNDRLIVYALMEDKSTQFDHNSSVELKTEQHRLGEAKVTQIPSVGNNAMIARLAAKALILELQHAKLPSSQKKSTGSLQTRFKEQQQSRASNNEDETMKEATKKRIIQLSLEYNILSPHTAFVGIEKRANASNTDMILREVPIQISADDQHLDLVSGMYSSYAPMLWMSMPSNMHYSIVVDEDLCLNEEEEPVRYCLDSYPESIGPVTTKSSLMKGAASSEKQNEDLWLTNNQDIVRHLIDKQKFDGSWDLDSKSIGQLTGKPLTVFQHLTNNQVLISAIVIAVLETRFASLSSMWHGVVQKARKRLVDLLGKDIKKLDTLLEDIRKQL
jgi:stringent starvation protein B